MGLFKRKQIEEKDIWTEPEQLPRNNLYGNTSDLGDNSIKLILSKLDLIEAKIKNIEQQLVNLERVKQILDEILEANDPQKKW